MALSLDQVVYIINNSAIPNFFITIFNKIPNLFLTFLRLLKFFLRSSDQIVVHRHNLAFRHKRHTQA